MCVACSSCTVILFVFFFFLYDNDKRVSCMFYSTLCLKVGVYFQNVFELNTAEHKISWVHDTAFGGRLGRSKSRKRDFLQSK